MDRIFGSLIDTLQRLAKDDKIEFSAAKVAIWRCISEEVHANDKKAFSEKLRERAISEERDAPTTLEKSFWRDVAEFALNPERPKEWTPTSPRHRDPSPDSGNFLHNLLG